MNAKSHARGALMTAWITSSVLRVWWRRDTVRDAPLRNGRLCSATALMFFVGILRSPIRLRFI